MTSSKESGKDEGQPLVLPDRSASDFDVIPLLPLAGPALKYFGPETQKL